MAVNWSIEEVEATVADYFSMLESELRGEAYNKSAHRRKLKSLLSNRSEGAIERKHQNISAVLQELGHPWIDGYKRLGNYQQLLFDVIEERLEGDVGVRGLVEQIITATPDVPGVRDPDAVVADAPEPDERGPREYGIEEKPTERRARKVDYLSREARNQAIGRAGEEFVLRFEAERLHRAGRRRLSERIDHVSESKGDGLGYDILSYEPDGRERLIEVKTTSFSKRTPFYVTRNELSCSVEREPEYHLYRVFSFRKEPRLYWLNGRLDHSFQLNAIQYEARR